MELTMAITDIERVRRARLAKQIYDETIRPTVEPARVGEFVAVDVDSGEFEVDADKLAALDRLRARRPDARPFLLRAGFPTAAVVGGPMRTAGRCSQEP